MIKSSNLSTYADDTQIFFGDKDPLIVQESRNSDLSYVHKWFLEKSMKRNHSEYQAMVMGHKKVNPGFRWENNIIPNSDVVQMLRVTVDDMIKFDKQIANICRKESQQVAVLRCFDTVFQKPYRYFSIALKVVFSLSDCYKILTSNWLWI